MCAGIEFSGADEVSDVLEDEKIGLFEHAGTLRGKRTQSAGYHVRVNVAQAAVVDLKGFNARGVRDALGIQSRLDIDVHDADRQLIFEFVYQGGQKCCFATARAGHEVEHGRFFICEHAPDRLCRGGIVCKNAFFYFDSSNNSHICLLYAFQA